MPRKPKASLAVEQLALGRRLFDEGRKQEALDPLARAFLLGGRALFLPDGEKYLKRVLQQLEPPAGYRSWNAWFKAEDAAAATAEPEPTEDEVVDELQRKAGKTPLHAAIADGDSARARRLVDGGADVNARYDEGDIVSTPLHEAAHHDLPSLVKLLLAAGARVEPRGTGQSPLHCARSVAVAKLLLDAGAKLEARDTEGRTPLWRAIDCSLPRKLVELYVERGADLGAKAYGKTVLAVAEREDPQLAAWLKRRGAR